MNQTIVRAGPRVALAVATLALVVSVAPRGGLALGPAPTSAPWDGVTTRTLALGGADVALAVPATGARVAEVKAQPWDGPEVAWSHARVARGGDVWLTIDVWPNPERHNATTWLSGPQAYLIPPGGGAALYALPGGAEPAVLVHWPRSPQAFARTVAFVALDGWLVRLTLERPDDGAATAAFDAALHTLHVASRTSSPAGRRTTP